MSEISDIYKIPEDAFPITFNIIYQYRRKNSVLMTKLISAIYKLGYFLGENHKHFNLIMCGDDIVI